MGLDRPTRLHQGLYVDQVEGLDWPIHLRQGLCVDQVEHRLAEALHQTVELGELGEDS